MSDPTAFRNAYSTAASVTVSKASGTPSTGEAWTLTVKSSGGATLGSPRTVSFVGGFDTNGEGAIGAALLDLEVIHGAWTGTGDTRTATAVSQRA